MIINACSFGNVKTASSFLKATRASFVAGYSQAVPWMESMLVDLMFLTYFLQGRCKRLKRNGRLELVCDRRGDFSYAGTRDPLKAARWVLEDFPLAEALRFGVHRRRKRDGRWVIEGIGG